MKQILGMCVAAPMILGGCAPSAERLRLEAAAVEGGTATVFIIMPCTPNNWIVPDSLMPEYKIVIDDKTVGTISQCQHKTITVASGKRGIHVDSKTWFGTASISYPIPPKSELYLRASYDYGNARLSEVNAEDGRANIGRIDRRELL